jgi:hypothetical protein
MKQTCWSFVAMGAGMMVWPVEVIIGVAAAGGASVLGLLGDDIFGGACRNLRRSEGEC